VCTTTGFWFTRDMVEAEETGLGLGILGGWSFWGFPYTEDMKCKVTPHQQFCVCLALVTGSLNQWHHGREKLGTSDERRDCKAQCAVSFRVASGDSKLPGEWATQTAMGCQCLPKPFVGV